MLHHYRIQYCGLVLSEKHGNSGCLFAITSSLPTIFIRSFVADFDALEKENHAWPNDVNQYQFVLISMKINNL